MPTDSRRGERRRPAAVIRRRLARLVSLPSSRVPPPAREEQEAPVGRGGIIRRRVVLDPGSALPVPGLFLRPEGRGPFPAVLFIHSHGHRYDLGKSEMLEPGGGAGTLVRGLLAGGCAVFGIDAPCFGERREDEGEAARRLFLEGDSLFAAMLRDEAAAFDHLRSRPDVLPSRVGCAGFSMGGTKALWLAALDPRLRAAVSVCALTTYHALLRARAFSRHQWYYFIPGVLAAADLDGVAALVAPRPLLCLNAAGDDKAPLEGFREAVRTISRAYASGDRRCFLSRLVPGPHRFTAGMGREAARWLLRTL
ncbi:MAG: dienelactone hydrolase family protein [bacterium]|nr:dienelactone hydrolase family protein [bacterium]